MALFDFKNIWDARGKYGSGNDENKSNRSVLLDSGPDAWKQESSDWKNKGEKVSNQFSRENLDADGNLMLPTPENTDNPDHIIVDPIAKRKQIKVYVDPGHAYDSGAYTGNTGGEGTISYKHKVKGADGKAETNPDGSDKVIETPIGSLPDYVLKDLHDHSVLPGDWVTKRVTDHNRTERDLVFDVGVKLNALLVKIGYDVKISRTTTDHGSSLEARVKEANDWGAHYFISIHADGKEDYRDDEAFAIYQPNPSDSAYTLRELNFANDIMSSYTHAGTVGAARTPDDSFYALSPTKAKSLRKTIVELGVTSNNTWYDNTIAPPAPKDIAVELAKGLESNVNSNYFMYYDFVGYRLNGKFYTIEELPDQFDITKVQAVYTLKNTLPIDKIDVDSFAKDL